MFKISISILFVSLAALVIVPLGMLASCEPAETSEARIKIQEKQMSERIQLRKLGPIEGTNCTLYYAIGYSAHDSGAFAVCPQVELPSPSCDTPAQKDDISFGQFKYKLKSEYKFNLE